ncbi:MAG TPA: tetratricopeptide repeat protein [Gemmataceae bacterium]|nr:tetratricopeptide repeat protein [Gemmataceae bacterium]
MADNDVAILPPPSPEHRRIAAGQFERANQVIATGNYDYGIQLLLTCCKLDPANLIYRQALRQTEKTKYKNNRRGSRLALLTTSAARAKMKAAKRARDYLKVLVHGEEVLARNPWDTSAQLEMAAAADALGLLDLAIWILDQARQKDPRDVTVNRTLARLCEKGGHFNQAINLWELVRVADPKDMEAARKGKDLAASDTIARTRVKRLATSQENGGAAEVETETEPAGPAPAKPAAPQPVQENPPAKPLVDRVANEAGPLWTRIKADPTNANAYLHLAGLYRRVGQLDQARAVLEGGLGPTGNQFDLAAELADLDMEPFRRNLALTDDKLRAQPQDEELRKIRIRLLKEINTRELDLYRQKADRYPSEKGYRFELGLRLLRARQVDEAILELQAARADPRHQWRALLYLGYCFKQRNNWRLAQRNFEESLRNIPPGEKDSRKEVLFQLAQGSAEAGDLAKAVDLGYELADLDFAYRDIGRLLDAWQSRLDAVNSDQ